MKTHKANDELRPEYDLGQLLIQINRMRLPLGTLHEKSPRSGLVAGN
jgi:hypothetical protein